MNSINARLKQHWQAMPSEVPIAAALSFVGSLAITAVFTGSLRAGLGGAAAAALATLIDAALRPFFNRLFTQDKWNSALAIALRFITVLTIALPLAASLGLAPLPPLALALVAYALGSKIHEWYLQGKPPMNRAEPYCL